MFGKKKRKQVEQPIQPSFNLGELTSKLNEISKEVVIESIARQILIGKERRLAKLFYGIPPKNIKSNPKSIQEIAELFAIELEEVEAILESAHSKLALIKL